MTIERTPASAPMQTLAPYSADPGMCVEPAAADQTEVAALNVEPSLAFRSISTAETGAASAVSFPNAAPAAGPSLAGYAPKAGRYTASDNSRLFDVDALRVSNVSSSQDRVRFTVSTTIDLPWPKNDVSKTTTMDVTRTPGTNRVYVDMGSQGGFNGTVRFGTDGTMTITPNKDQGTGGVDSISIGRGGQPITIKIEAPIGSAYNITARPA